MRPSLIVTQNDPNLQGRVVVKFVIARDGSVSRVQGSGSLLDASVVSCVSSASDVYKALESVKCTVVSSTTIGGVTKFLAKSSV